ncbi:unnamed protein product, partial [Menidia menidia]
RTLFLTRTGVHARGWEGRADSGVPHHPILPPPPLPPSSSSSSSSSDSTFPSTRPFPRARVLVYFPIWSRFGADLEQISREKPDAKSAFGGKERPIAWCGCVGEQAREEVRLRDAMSAKDADPIAPGKRHRPGPDGGLLRGGGCHRLRHHLQRRWEGGDPGVSNQKTPTTILLTPDRKFHSFGYAARDFYHDLDPSESKQWLYLEKFKMKLHTTANLSIDTDLHAANGKRVKALDIFAYALAFFKEQALKELSDQTGGDFENSDVRWVITVPAIWKMPAKQFMREAAYKSGLVSRENPEQLIIALEPEAASIYCRKLRLHQMVDLGTQTNQNGFSPTDNVGSGMTQAKEHVRRNRQSRTFLVENVIGELWSELEEGDRYVVVDCGGPYGSIGIDYEFEKLLCKIFGQDFIDQFKIKRPAAWVDLMIAFESRKRAAAPDRTNPLNINLPFSFIDYYKKFRGHSVEHALRKSNVDFVKWSSQGMLRMNPDAMNSLFKPTIDHIIQHLTDLFEKPEVSDIKFLFLVGGFAESSLLQQAVQDMLRGRSRIIIPHDVGLTILKGAVLFGLDPGVIKVRRSPLTYGVGVLNRFVEGKHPPEKLLVKDGTRWCTDVFDTFIAADQSVALGELVKRSYTPARPSQQVIVIHVYCAEREGVGFISEPGVRKCGTLRLDVSGTASAAPRREIQTLMQFGDTEIRAMAVDIKSPQPNTTCSPFQRPDSIWTHQMSFVKKAPDDQRNAQSASRLSEKPGQ